MVFNDVCMNSFHLYTIFAGSGGISLKPSLNMEDMRADMGGAACTLASIYGAALLKLPINLRGTLD